MATARNYSNTASQAQLSAAIAATDTSITLTAFSGYPAAPFTAAIARGTANEEIVLVTAVSSSTVTVTRGYDGTTAKAQGAGSTFQEVAVALDFRDANTHVTSNSGVHGVTGSVVGTTDVQTLTNKTLTSPTSTNPTDTGTSTIATASITTLNVSGVSTLAGLSATTGSFSSTLTVTGAATLNGGVSTTTVTGTGLVKGAGLETTAGLTVPVASADPAGVAGKSSIYTKADGLWVRVDSAGAALRVPRHLGSGTAFPTGPGAGDVFFHSGVGCQFAYDGTNWRQDEVCVVANAAARTALSTTYASALHTGFQVWQTDVLRGFVWNGKWQLAGGTIPAVTVGRTADLVATVNAFTAVPWQAITTADSGTDATSMWASGNATRLVAVADGFHEVTATLQRSVATGTFYLAAKLNGTSPEKRMGVMTNGSAFELTGTARFKMVAGDYVEILYNTDTACNITYASAESSPRGELTWLGNA